MANISNSTSGSLPPSKGRRQDRVEIYTGDIHAPWQSPHGFSITAARLAAGQQLVLHCREDEIVDYLDRLNALLGSPQCLERAYGLLAILRHETRYKLVPLLRLREEPLSSDEVPDLIADIEASLVDDPASTPPPTVVDRLACMLSPDDPLREIAGLEKMFTRLQRIMAALRKVKNQGFQVAVVNRQRQPKRSPPKLRRNISGAGDGNPDQLSPADYHLTLWAYGIVRIDDG